MRNKTKKSKQDRISQSHKRFEYTKWDLLHQASKQLRRATQAPRQIIIKKIKRLLSPANIDFSKKC